MRSYNEWQLECKAIAWRVGRCELTKIEIDPNEDKYTATFQVKRQTEQTYYYSGPTDWKFYISLTIYPDVSPQRVYELLTGEIDRLLLVKAKPQEVK